MTNKERQILDVFATVIPQLTELEKERVLGYAEGMNVIKTAQTSDANHDREEATHNDADSHR